MDIALSDHTFLQKIKDIYFERCTTTHFELWKWASSKNGEFIINDVELDEIGISQKTLDVIEDIDVQWDLYLVNTYSIEQLVNANLNSIKLPRSYFASWYRKLKGESLDYAARMNWNLLEEVEQSLREDLNQYCATKELFHFDWSDACIEGHLEEVKGGVIENLSNIRLVDYFEVVRFEGWMNFIFEKDFNYYFVIYWDYLSDATKGDLKTKSGIPAHIFNKLPDNLKDKYRAQAMR